MFIISSLLLAIFYCSKTRRNVLIVYMDKYEIILFSARLQPTLFSSSVLSCHSANDFDDRSAYVTNIVIIIMIIIIVLACLVERCRSYERPPCCSILCPTIGGCQTDVKRRKIGLNRPCDAVGQMWRLICGS